MSPTTNTDNLKTNLLTRRISAVIVSIFGALTLFMSSAVLWDWFGIRAMEGQYVDFIVWANFCCSWLYLLAGYGFLQYKKWTFPILGLALAILIIAFIALQVHIGNGGDYESKTVKAMVFRISVTVIFSLIAFYKIHKTSPH